MDRRTLLGAAAGTLLAGCLTQSPDPGAEDGNGTVASPPPPSPARSESFATDSGNRIAVGRTRSYTHAVRLNDLGEVPPGEWIPTIGDLSERRRAVVRDALEGRYTTESVPVWLERFVDEVSHVRQDGQFFELQAAVPTTTITAERVDRNDVSGGIATNDEYRVAVLHGGETETDLLARAQDGGVRLSWVWPNLASFLDRYDAAEYRGNTVAFAASKSDPGPPYTVTATEVPPVRAVDAPAWPISDEPPDVREVVRDAATRRGLYASEGLPEGVVANLRRHRYVYLDGTFYWIGVEHAGPHPLSIRASVVDERLDPEGARLRVTLENGTDRAVTVASGPPPPFGVLHYRPPGAVRTIADQRRLAREGGLLWSPAYRESRHVDTDGHDVEGWHSVALETTMQPAGALSRTFTVTDSPDLGTYVVRDNVRYDAGPAGEGTFPYEVRFRVEPPAE